MTTPNCGCWTEDVTEGNHVYFLLSDYLFKKNNPRTWDSNWKCCPFCPQEDPEDPYECSDEVMNYGDH